MSKNIALLMLLTLLATACHKKSSDTADNGCISGQRVMQSQYSISADDYTSAVALFQKNNIPYGNLRWYYYNKDTEINSGVTDNYYFIRGDQYVNGLRVFNVPLIHHFKNGVFFQVNGDVITSTIQDTTAKLALSQVRKLFVDKLLSTKSPIDLKKYKADCMKTEFGYYNLNNGTGSSPVNLTKAWLVYPETNDRVFAYIGDDGSMLGFSDGTVVVF